MRTPEKNKLATKISSSLLVVAFFSLNHLGWASQADETTITIAADNPGPTPFISQLTLVTSDPAVLASIQFSIMPKPGSVTRPLSGTYSSEYLTSRGNILPGSDTIFLPIYGLYADYANTVTLTYRFLDGSSKTDNTTITSPVYDDPCQYGNPTILQARTTSTALSYDFILVRERCSGSSPTVLDSDSNVRWVGPATIYNITSNLFNNSFYQASGRALNRIDLDGTFTFLHDYADIGVTYLHHNIDRGKVGLILDGDTASYFESTNFEVDADGNVLKIWDLAEIISAAMTAGGDDPSQFVFPGPTDWFHNNSVTYNRADDSIIISSRENFVICLEYETGAIKWILGDPTKAWYQFPSLQQYALVLPEGTNPPIGQHSVSIAYDQDLLLFDNGFASWTHIPKGAGRGYSSPRKYHVDPATMTATEVWSYPMGNTIFSAICSSIYEDAPFNYLVDYAYAHDVATGDYHAQLLGLDAFGATVFYYQYPNAPSTCQQGYNSVPLHFENTKFPAVGPRALNVSTRGLVTSRDDTLIGGLIITGTESKLVALRVLGPSLSGSGIVGAVGNPSLTVYDSTGQVVATNDDWATDPASAGLIAVGLAPSDPLEAATQQSLAPGAYTVIARSQDGTSGVGLVEAYDVSPTSNSKLGNLSTRGFVGLGEDALIGGFIVGDVANSPLIVRAMGPSLAGLGTSDALDDPSLTIYDGNGTAIAANDDWEDGAHKLEVQNNGLAPVDASESALSLFLPPGEYSAIVDSANSGTGVGLVEVYALE